MQPFENLFMPEPEEPRPQPVPAAPEVDVEAEFTLEAAAVCPACRCSLDTINIVRLLRTRVNFVSSLPRRGHLMVCPHCKTVLTGSLGGLV